MTDVSTIQTRLDYDPGSFRDRSSRVVLQGKRILWLLDKQATEEWRAVSSNPVYEQWVSSGRLIASKEIQHDDALKFDHGHWQTVLEHRRIPFVSYPYEWTFGMLKDAALLQLELQAAALQQGLTSKDVSAYNVQWQGSKPQFIDVVSLERLTAGQPWAGYRQFCELFLFPLMLQAYKGLNFQPWLRGRLDGIQAGELVKTLSLRDRLRPGVTTHVVVQAALQSRMGGVSHDLRPGLEKAGFNKRLIQRNVARLTKLVRGMEWKKKKSEWSDYAATHSYADKTLAEKSAFVDRIVAKRRPSLVWDLGCNQGNFSRIAAAHSTYVLALDQDILTLENLYQQLKAESQKNILPLYFNIADPSPELGWCNRERRSLPERGRPDLCLALALIHHLVIGANYFHHTTLPHSPWTYLPSGKRYGSVAKDKNNPKRKWPVGDFPRTPYQRHLLQAMFADSLLQKMLTTLTLQDLYDSSVIIVTADHGASFRPGAGFREVDDDNAADILNIPLFIKTPNQASPERHPQPVSTVDVVPTLLQILGQSLSWEFDGIPANQRNDSLPSTVTVYGKRGTVKQVIFDPELRSTAIAERIALFGTGNSNSIYAERHPALIGKDITDLVTTDVSPATFSVDKRRTMLNIPEDTNWLPALIGGTVHSFAPSTGPHPLAIVLNDFIAAITIPKPDADGAMRFSSVLDDRFFLAGPNRLQTFWLIECSGRLCVQALSDSP